MIYQEEIHKQCFSDNSEERIEGLNQLKSNFSRLPDKQKAWTCLIKLTSDENIKVQLSVGYILTAVLFYVPDKQQVWNDLIRLCYDNYKALDLFNAVASAFTYVPDKYKAWNDLHKLSKDKDPRFRGLAVTVLTLVFDQIQNKKQAWKDIHRLTNDRDPHVRAYVAGFLCFAIPSVPDKQHAWKHLIKLVNDGDSNVQKAAVKKIYYAIPHVPDKQKVWNDLINVVNNNYWWTVQIPAASALGYVFSEIPNKQKAWEDLQRLTNNDYENIRQGAAFSLGHAYSHIPNQEEAWEALHRLANDDEGRVRGDAAKSLGYAFSYILNKDEAWKDLHRLANDDHWLARIGAAGALGNALPLVSNKEQAWEDLHKLLNSKHKDEKIKAIESLYSSFTYINDKQMAFEDLHRLIEDDNKYVRGLAGTTIGHVFADIPDKQKAWEDLVKLTTDKESTITREHAYYDLGKVSIFKASEVENEDDYKKELEKAIEFFEKSSKESYEWYKPAQFCLPFYRTFYTIIFKQERAQEDIDKYLTEAEYAIQGSKRKEQLFEIIVTLANALEEAQNLGNLDLDLIKSETKLYTKYFDYVEELLKDAEKKAPFAVRTMRKGLPILKKNISEVLEDIQKKTEQISEQTKGTPFEQLGNELSWSVQSLLQVTDPIGFKKDFEYFEINLSNISSKLPESQEIRRLLKCIKEEQSIGNKIPLMNDLSSEILYQLGKMNSDKEKNGFIDSFATRASFLGFIVLELLNIWRPLGDTNHIICLLVIIIFFFGSVPNFL